MVAPALLPEYAFTLTEVNLMWAHVEAEIVLRVAQAGARIEAAIEVRHACNPFGDHAEWQWTERLSLSGSVEPGPSAAMARIVPDDGRVVPSLTFEVARPAHDTPWPSDGERVTPAFDFWHPLFGWAWARQARAWCAPLADDDLARAMRAHRPLSPLTPHTALSEGLGERLRYFEDGRFAIARGYGYALEPGAELVARRIDAGDVRGFALVLRAYRPERVAELLCEVPADPDLRDDRYRLAAGRRPEYLIGWLPEDRAREADAWLAALGADLAARLRVR